MQYNMSKQVHSACLRARQSVGQRHDCESVGMQREQGYRCTEAQPLELASHVPDGTLKGQSRSLSQNNDQTNKACLVHCWPRGSEQVQVQSPSCQLRAGELGQIPCQYCYAQHPFTLASKQVSLPLAAEAQLGLTLQLHWRRPDARVMGERR